MRLWLWIAAFMLVLPLRTFAVDTADPAVTQIPPPSAEGTQSVPEPDEEEEPSAMPPEEEDNLPPPAAVKPTEKTLPPAEHGETGFDEVVLQGLNKVTARASTIEAPIGSVVRFGTIEIIAHSCWKAAPEERPENAALLEISEIKQGEPPKRIFLGWMFSSSPGLSSLEHPFYDITVIECKKEEGGKNR